MYVRWRWTLGATDQLVSSSSRTRLSSDVSVDDARVLSLFPSVAVPLECLYSSRWGVSMCSSVLFVVSGESWEGFRSRAVS